MVLFACCGQDFVLVLLVFSLKEPWPWLQSDHVFASSATELNCKVLSLCCPLRSFNVLVEPSVRLDIYPQLTAGAAVGLLCMVILLSPQGRITLEWCWSLLGLLMHYQDCGTSLNGLWLRVCWKLGESSGECGGRVYAISKVCASQLKEGTAASWGNSSLGLDSKEPVHGRMSGWGMLLAS